MNKTVVILFIGLLAFSMILLKVAIDTSKHSSISLKDNCSRILAEVNHSNELKARKREESLRDAIEDLKKLDLNDEIVTMSLAYSFMFLPNWDSVYVYYSKSKKIAPDQEYKNVYNYIEANLAVNYSNTLVAQKNYKLAEKLIEDALKVNFNNPPVINAKAYLFSALGRNDSAEIYYRYAVKLSPNNQFALQQLRTMYFSKAQELIQMSQIEPAINILQRAEQLLPKDIVILQNIAVLLEQTSNNQLAMQYYQKILQINPRHSLALSKLGGR